MKDLKETMMLIDTSISIQEVKLLLLSFSLPCKILEWRSATKIFVLYSSFLIQITKPISLILIFVELQHIKMKSLSLNLLSSRKNLTILLNQLKRIYIKLVLLDGHQFLKCDKVQEVI